MQRLLECPICLNYYDTKVRVPKSLLCGHGFCSPCLTDLVIGTTVKCPKCRQDCDLSTGSVSKLPTSYATLDMLDTSCEQCRDQPFTHRCHHCSRNLCDKCEVLHLDRSGSDTRTEINAVREAAAKLRFQSSTESILKQINSQGEYTIGQINRSYAEYSEELRHHNQKLISKVRAQIHKDTEAFLTWRENVNKLASDVDNFVDRSLAEIEAVNSSNDEQVKTSARIMCSQHMNTIKSASKQKPSPAKVTFQQQHQEFDQFLSRCGEVIVSESDLASYYPYKVDIPSAPSVSGLSKQNNIPDYSLATFRDEVEMDEFSWPWGLAITPHKFPDMIVTDYLSAVTLHVSSERLSADVSGPSSAGTFTTQISTIRDAHKPSGVAVSKENKVYITDHAHHCVHVVDGSGQAINKFGLYGNGPGQFNMPNDLALDDHGLLYVCDGKNFRVQVFKEDGAFSHILGHSDNNHGVQFTSSPLFIAVSNVTVTVSDYRGDLHIITTEGKLVKTLPAKQVPHNMDATGVALDRHGNVIVADAGGRLLVLRADGQYVCDVGSRGTGPGQLMDPRGVCITDDGDIAVCDMANHRIQLFNIPNL